MKEISSLVIRVFHLSLTLLIVLFFYVVKSILSDGIQLLIRMTFLTLIKGFTQVNCYI